MAPSHDHLKRGKGTVIVPVAAYQHSGLSSRTIANDGGDLGTLLGDWGTALPDGDLSAPATRNRIGYCGYVFAPETRMYLVRYRWHLPPLGRWGQRDPAGYVDGMSLYQYVRSRPCTWLDPFGLFCEDECRDGEVSVPEIIEVRLRPFLRYSKPSTIEAGVCAVRGAQLVQRLALLGGVGKLFVSIRSASIKCGNDIDKLHKEVRKIFGQYVLEQSAEEAVACLGIDPEDAIKQLLAFDFTLMEREGAAVWLKVRWHQCEERCCCFLWTQRRWIEKNDWITCADGTSLGGGIDPGNTAAIDSAVNNCSSSFVQLFRDIVGRVRSAQCFVDDWNRSTRGCYSNAHLSK